MWEHWFHYLLHLCMSFDSNEENALGRRMLLHYIALGLLGNAKSFWPFNFISCAIERNKTNLWILALERSVSCNGGYEKTKRHGICIVWSCWLHHGIWLYLLKPRFHCVHIVMLNTEIQFHSISVHARGVCNVFAVCGYYCTRAVFILFLFFACASSSFVQYLASNRKRIQPFSSPLLLPRSSSFGLAKQAQDYSTTFCIHNIQITHTILCMDIMWNVTLCWYGWYQLFTFCASWWVFWHTFHGVHD